MILKVARTARHRAGWSLRRADEPLPSMGSGAWPQKNFVECLHADDTYSCNVSTVMAKLSLLLELSGPSGT
jgi:hypothetical protein